MEKSESVELHFWDFHTNIRTFSSFAVCENDVQERKPWNLQLWFSYWIWAAVCSSQTMRENRPAALSAQTQTWSKWYELVMVMVHAVYLYSASLPSFKIRVFYSHSPIHTLLLNTGATHNNLAQGHFDTLAGSAATNPAFYLCITAAPYQQSSENTGESGSSPGSCWQPPWQTVPGTPWLSSSPAGSHRRCLMWCWPETPASERGPEPGRGAWAG